MASQQSSEHMSWFSGRTRLITVASIIAVIIAGATAVGANIGILDSASDGPVGSASAAGDLSAPLTRVVDVYAPRTTGSADGAKGPAQAVQHFDVDVAGTVAVAATDDGIRLDGVTPSAGWTWVLTQRTPMELAVTMTNGARTVEFTAARTAEGNIAARVDEPIVTSRSDDHGKHDDDHDDDHDKHEKHDDDDD